MSRKLCCLLIFLLSLTISASKIYANGEADLKLIEAIKNLDVDGVRSALKAGANPLMTTKKEDDKPLSLLELCLSKSPSSVCSRRDLLLCREMIDQIGKKRLNQQEKCYECLILLFDAGAKIRAYDGAILYWAVINEFPKAAELLLSQGASPNAQVASKSLIEISQERQCTPINKMLLKHGAYSLSDKEIAQARLVYLANATLPYYEDPIFEMSKCLANGANINDYNKRGETALLASVSQLPSREQYFRLLFLLQRGANPNIRANAWQPKSGNTTPLHQAIFWGGFVSAKDVKFLKLGLLYSMLTVMSLLDANANVSALDEDGQTPLHTAAKWNNAQGANILIKAGAKIITKDNSGKIPLDYAESAEMIKLLKSHSGKEE